MAIIAMLFIIALVAGLIPAAMCFVSGTVDSFPVLNTNTSTAHADEQYVWLGTYTWLTSVLAVCVCYTHIKWSMKANKRSTRTVQGKRNHMYACNGVYIARGIRSTMMSGITAINTVCVRKAEGRKALMRATNARSASYSALPACGIKASKRASLGINHAVRAIRTANVHTPVYMVVHADRPSIAQHDDVHKLMHTPASTAKRVQAVYAEHKCTRPTARVIQMRHAGKVRHMALVAESRGVKFMGYMNAMVAKGLVIDEAHIKDLVTRATDRNHVVRDTAWAEVKVMMSALYRERSIKTAFAWHNKVQGYSTTCQELAGSKSFKSRMEAAKWMAYEDSVAVLDAAMVAA